MNELMEELEKLNKEKITITIVSMNFSTHWSVWFEKNSDGVQLKIETNGETLADALNNAIMKWRRVTDSVVEFRGKVIDQIPFNDEIPF